MGCNNTKKLPEDEEHAKKGKLYDVPSREFCPPRVNNEVGKNAEKKPKKGRVIQGRFRFDPIVTENYDIKALIGRGSFSRVVRVEHKVTKEPYALKMIKIEGGKDTLESEVAVLRKVNHKYIVKLFEVFQCAERVYLVMELATGGELFERIVSRGSFTEKDATEVLCMVLEGVCYLHSLGITHRDLKPENLLYYHPGPDSRILITDFGLSKTRQNVKNETMDTTCGTPEYIAPEILLRQPYTNAVDMWSIGVITHVLLSGQMPFADENRRRLYKAILDARYSYSGEAWRDVSDLAKDFIDSLLVLDPAKRMTAEDALKHLWIVAPSNLKNLQRSVSKNLRSHSRIPSGRSTCSQKSTKSSRSGRSLVSIRRSKNMTVPQDAGLISALSDGPALEVKQGVSKNSARRESSVKLTRQLVEKINEHSVINEDDGELPQSVSCEDKSELVEQRLIESQNTVSNTDHCSHGECKSCEITYDEKFRGLLVPALKQRSCFTRRDNFLDHHHRVHDTSHDFNFPASSSPAGRKHSLSASPRNNKVYCSYDTD